jgi:diguanylate cyclase (GGDEF)-like protein
MIDPLYEKFDLPNDDMSERPRAPETDFVAGGIVVAAIILFVGTGSTVFTSLIQTLSGYAGGADRALSVAVILNIALIIFGWRRYRDLQSEYAVRSEAEQRAWHVANTDPLTGFDNRRSIGPRAAKMIAASERERQQVAVFMLDLDQFKNVNDVYGHAAGDAVLKIAAQRIDEVMPEGTLKARLGGDEFVCVFVVDPAEPDAAQTLAENLVSALARPMNHDNLHVAISTSLGIAELNGDASTISTLMRRADIAMYAAKDRGKNCYAWFSDDMESELHRRNDLEQGVRNGIPRGEFEPFFEPQVDLASGRLEGFEMLARWRSPTFGLVSPEIFIPIAEESGLISDLSLSVMRQALDAAKTWDHRLTISVNISPAQLKDPWLAQKIVKLLAETGFPANRLEIEITETSLFENLGLAQSIVASLKNQGIQVSLDDFGTGYSSLAHLRALPFDRIKIDRSFVSSMVETSDSAAIVSAIIKLGETLNMPVTAEGIETEEIGQMLVEMGCSKGQGWHFGRPMGILATHKLLIELGHARPADQHASGELSRGATGAVAVDHLDAPRVASVIRKAV